MSDKKALRIAYFCHIDWDWIKQRPQFLAEGLALHYHVEVISPWSNRRKNLVKNPHKGIRLHRIFSVPCPGKLKKYVTPFNRFLQKIEERIAVRMIRPDVVWISHPTELPGVPKPYLDRIVYDCMDHYAAIEPAEEKRARIATLEEQVLSLSKLVFASSETLRKRLVRQNPNAEAVLLRNGYMNDWGVCGRSDAPFDGKVRIGYFGTVGRWFDFDALTETVKVNPSVEFHIYGPIEQGVPLPQMERLFFHGSLPHSRIPEEAGKLSALIMPFTRSDVVDSVDPVKLYEYIHLLKPIFSVRYPEIERFQPYVTFYENAAELAEEIRELSPPFSSKYSRAEAESFLAENTWERRTETAVTCLMKCIVSETLHES